MCAAKDGKKVVFHYNHIESVVEDLLCEERFENHFHYKYKALHGYDSTGQWGQMRGPFYASEYMRAASEACAEDEYPICISCFSDGVNVMKNGEGHPIFGKWRPRRLRDTHIQLNLHLC